MKSLIRVKILIALIHNQKPERLKHIKPSLNRLRREFSSDFDIEFFEISKQPEIIPNKILLTMYRKFLLWKINREWMQYRLLKPRNIILDIAILFLRLAVVFFNRKLETRRSWIESVIGDKHIRAWGQFLEKNADFLICFEDDVVFEDGSIINLKKIIKNIKKYIRKPVYLDLAGGNSQDIIKVSMLEYKSDQSGRYYRKPVTNTACCYMITNSTAQIFHQYLLKRPWLRLLCADWLMNKLFILTTPEYNYFCFHAYPHVFKHGSIEGVYETSI